MRLCGAEPESGAGGGDEDGGAAPGGGGGSQGIEVAEAGLFVPLGVAAVEYGTAVFIEPGGGQGCQFGRGEQFGSAAFGGCLRCGGGAGAGVDVELLQFGRLLGESGGQLFVQQAEHAVEDRAGAAHA